MLSRSLNIVRAFAPVPLLKTMAKIMPDPIWKFKLANQQAKQHKLIFYQENESEFFFLAREYGGPQVHSEFQISLPVLNLTPNS